MTKRQQKMQTAVACELKLTGRGRMVKSSDLQSLLFMLSQNLMSRRLKKAVNSSTMWGREKHSTWHLYRKLPSRTPFDWDLHWV